MGRVHKLLLWSCLRGILIGWILLAVIFALNVMNMRYLVFSSSHHILATFLLMVGFAITFGNASMGHALMRLTKDPAEDKD